MSRLGEQVLFALLLEKASIDYLASEGLSEDFIPSEDLRPVYTFCLDYYEKSGRLGAPTAAVLKETHDSDGQSYYYMLADHEIAYGDEFPTESIQWAIQDLRDSHLTAQMTKQVRALFEEIAAVPPGGDRVPILARGVGVQVIPQLSGRVFKLSTPPTFK